MYRERFVANATLVEIRKEDGAQRYILDREKFGSNVLWLSGWPRASNPVIGMKGQIIYRSTSTYGLHFFVREKANQGHLTLDSKGCGTTVYQRIDKFHAHLDICSQCRNHPFNLCSTGAKLLREAATFVSREDAINVCKLGRGADCCIWLAVGQNGFECLYHSRSEGRNLLGETLEEMWKAGKTVAKRDGCNRVKALGGSIKG